MPYRRPCRIFGYPNERYEMRYRLTDVAGQFLVGDLLEQVQELAEIAEIQDDEGNIMDFDDWGLHYRRGPSVEAEVLVVEFVEEGGAHEGRLIGLCEDVGWKAERVE